MPTYAYSCTSCRHQFDALQSFVEDALTVCPECGGALRKQYGSIGVTFNGSGFYRTDSRAKSEGSQDASTSSKKEPTTSAKPAAAPTPTSS